MNKAKITPSIFDIPELKATENTGITQQQANYLGNDLLTKTSSPDSSVQQVPNLIDHGFINGFENSLAQLYNVVAPGDYQIPVNDTAGITGTVGEIAGAIVNPINFFPALGAEVLAGKVAAKVGTNILNMSLEEVSTSIASRIFKNSIAGGVGGALDAYQRQNSKLDADYLTSIIGGATLGVIGGEVINKLTSKFSNNELGKFIQDTPNLQNDLDDIANGGIPVDNKVVSLSDVQAQTPPIEQPLVMPEFKAPSLSDIQSDPRFKPYKIITPRKNKRLDVIDESQFTNDLNAIADLRTEAQSELDKSMFDMDIANRRQTKLDKVGRKQAELRGVEIQQQLDDLEFMEAQINAQKSGKQAVLKTDDELDRDAIRFDKLVEKENQRAQAQYEKALAEFRSTQEAQEAERVRLEQEKIKTEIASKQAQFLYNNIDKKDIEGLTAHIDAHTNVLVNELDNLVRQWRPDILKALEHGGSQKWLMKALYGEPLPANISQDAMYAVKKWRELGSVIIDKYRQAGVPTGKIDAYYTKITHYGDLVKNAGIDKYLADINGWLKVPFSDKEELLPFYNDIVSINPVAGDEIERRIENLSRRFIFKNSDAEFMYRQTYSYNHTPMQALRGNITYNSKRIAIANALGKYPTAVVNEFDRLAGPNKEAARALINKLFPQSVGYFPTGADYVTAFNFAAQAAKLFKTIVNPKWQIRYMFGDRIDNMAYMAQRTSIWDAMTTSFKKSPEFAKKLAELPSSDKISLREAWSNYKNDLLSANLIGHGFLSPSGKLNTTTKLIRNLEFMINGSHEADVSVRRGTATSYAYMLRDAYKSGNLFPNIDRGILAKAVDKNGFINPELLLKSKDLNDLEVGRFLAAQYNEAVTAVNPLGSTAWTSVGKDNPAALKWVSQAAWTFNTTKNVQLPLLKTLVSSEVGGISRLRAGSILVSFATLQTALDEGFDYLGDIIEGKEYKPDKLAIAGKFLGYMTLGHTFWAYKLSATTAYYGGSSLYYGAKSLIEDRSQDKALDEQKFIDNAKKASYAIRLILAALHHDE
jgi:hypothetical protein